MHHARDCFITLDGCVCGNEKFEAVIDAARVQWRTHNSVPGDPCTCHVCDALRALDGEEE